MAYCVITNSGELYHHGILGQKWGQRNGPPYPLNYSQKNSKEKKVGLKKNLQKKIVDKAVNNSLAKEETKKGLTDKQKKLLKIGAAIAITGIAAYGVYKLADINATKYKNFVNADMFGGDTEIEKLGNMLSSPDFKEMSDYNPKEAFQYMPNDKDNLLSYKADIIATDHVSPVAKMLFSGDELKEEIVSTLEESENGWRENVVQHVFDKKNIDSWPSGVMSIIDDPDEGFEYLRDEINPDFVNNLDALNYSIEDDKTMRNAALSMALEYVPEDRTTNCMYCTTAFDLNKRGYKVKANGRTDGGPMTELLDMYKLKDDSLMHFKGKALNVKSITEHLSSYDNGEYARGNMIVTFKSGGSHSVAWEMVNSKVTVMDFQIGVKYEGKTLNEFLTSISDCDTVRTDNAELIWSDKLLSAIDYI